MRTLVYPVVLVLVALAVWWIVKPEATPDVVLYCGVDQDQSRQIADLFEEETGLTVLYQGESEAARAIGLPQRLRAEKDDPRADVFWSNEIMNMEDLSGRGLIGPLPAGAADGFPPGLEDPQGRYVAFGARARVLLVNTALLKEEDYPTSIEDLLDPKYKAMGLVTCMARPLTGTTYTHAVALLTRDEAAGRRFLDAVAEAGRDGRMKLEESNGRAMGQARDASNKVAFCLTDTDDAWVAIREGDPVTVIYPDQGEGQPGTVLIPNTVGLVKGAPHPEAGARLLRWLVGAENEIRLANGPSAQIPLRASLGNVELPAHVKRPGVDFRAAVVDWQKVGENRERWLDYLNARFRPAD